MVRRKATPGRDPQSNRRDRLLAWLFTAGVHVLVLAALFWPRPTAPALKDSPPPPPIFVSLLSQPQAKPAGPPDAAAPQMPEEIVPVTPPAPSPIIVTTAPDTSDILSEAQLAGAARAGEGGAGGGTCDTALAVQQALRHDPLVRSAVAEAGRQGKAIMMWNGDWVRAGGQEGKGLSAVRQAIMWEIAFSPEACRNAIMHGIVLLSLSDGGTRFAIGAGAWRWSDLLGVKKSAPER